jgi:hypothetical protein
MEYRKHINSYDPVETWHTTGYKEEEVLLEVGKTYKILYAKPYNKKEEKNNGREVEILGFTDYSFADVIVRYKDNNRIGRIEVSCMLPIESYIEQIKSQKGKKPKTNKTKYKTLDRYNRWEEIESIEEDSDGIWVYLKEGYDFDGWDSGTLSFDNVMGVLEEVKKKYIVKREEG